MINKKYVSTFVLCMLTLGCSPKGMAGFNLAFLTGDAKDIADISKIISQGQVPPGTYRVDIYLNNEFIAVDDVNFKTVVQKNKSHAGENSQHDNENALSPCFKKSTFLAFNILDNKQSAGNITGDCISLHKLVPESSYNFDFPKLRIDISIPQAMLARNARGYISPEYWDEGVNAALFDYNFNGDNSNNGKSYFLNLTSGLNVGAWRLRNTGNWNYFSGKHNKQQKWQNVGSYLSRAIIPLRGQLVIGDTSSGSDIFDSNSLRGVRFYSVDNMYPDSLQGYAPTVRGSARTDAKVIIRQNGYIVYQTYVSPGPFELNDITPQVTSGDLDVEVQEKDGSIQKFTQPYSTVPLLQREGRLKYEGIAGKFRSGAQNKSSPFYIQGTLLYGLPKGYTVYGGSQFSDKYQSYALGLGMNKGVWGAFSVDAIQANSELYDGSKHQGQSYRFLYAKSLEDFGTTIQLLGYRYSTSGYYTLDDISYSRMSGYAYNSNSEYSDSDDDVTLLGYYNLHNTRRGRFQVNVSQDLNGFGSVYASGTQQSYWNTDSKDKFYQLGYNTTVKNISFNMSFSYNKTRDFSDANKIFSVTLSVPLYSLFGGTSMQRRITDNMYATAGYSNDSQGGSRWNSGLSGALLEDRNLSYSLSQGHSSAAGNDGRISTNWQGTYGSVGVGYNYDSNYHSVNVQAAGGLIVHKYGITAGQNLGDANVLIAAPGADSVKVENATGVRTDWRGYTYLPYATVYRNNRVALDPKSFGDHMDIENNVQNVVPTAGALVIADYKASIGVRSILTLTKNGKPLPFGSVITEKSTGTTGIVGDNGEVYLTGLPVRSELIAKWGSSDYQTCKTTLQLSDSDMKKTIISKSLSCSI